MQALIDFLIRNILALWPIVRVAQWEVAMRIRNGIIKEELMPGLHWRWWFIDQVVKAWGTIITIDLPNALVTTTDGRSIIVSANLAYRIADIVKMWGKIVNSNETLRNIAIGFLADECANYSWNELVHLRTSIQDALREHLRAVVEPWGIAMEQVHLTDLAVTTPYRLYTDGVTNGITK